MPSNFTLPKPIAGTELTITDFTTSQTQVETAIRDLQDATPNNGSVTTVATVDTDVAQIFDATVTNASTTPTITFTRIAKAANLVYASPTTGADAVPTFRSLVAADLPTVPYTKGGNGLITIGSAYQMTRVNSLETVNEWFSMVAASGDKITLTPSSGTPNKLTIDVDPTKIEIDTLAAISPLSIAKGGTGQDTAQKAIDALAAVSVADSGKALIVDASGHVVPTTFDAGVSSVNGDTGVVVLTTADVAESGNLYFTDSRVTNNAEVLLNTAKVTNAAHTGDVTGSTALTIDKTAITGKTTVSAAQTDKVLISDTSDSGNLKNVLVSTIHNTAVKTVTGSPYTTVVADRNLFIDPSSTNIAVATPDISTLVGGERFFYKRISGGANTVAIQTGGKFIDGSSADISLPNNNSSIEIVYQGTDYFFIVSQTTGTP